MVVQEAIQLPPRSEANVIGHTGYRDLADTWNTWISKPDSPSDEIRVATAVVPNRCKNVPMRVMNVAGYPVTLPAEALLADLEAVEMVEDYKETAVRRDVGGRLRVMWNKSILDSCWTKLIPQYRPESGML